MIGCFDCPTTVNSPITLSDYNCTEWLVKYKAADAPSTFEEIVVGMINWETKLLPAFSILVCTSFQLTMIRALCIVGGRIFKNELKT